MKNLTVCLIVLLFTTEALSQNQLGPKIGANMVFPKFDNPAGISVSSGIDLSIGLFYSRGFNDGNKLRAEVNYYTNFDTEFEESGSVTVLKETSFVTIPVQYGLKLGKQEVFLLAGIYVNLTLNNDPNNEDVYDYLGNTISSHEGWWGYGSSSGSFAFGLGANVSVEYNISDFSINAYYQLPFFGSLYVLNDEYKLKYSHAGLAVGYNFIK